MNDRMTNRCGTKDIAETRDALIVLTAKLAGYGSLTLITVFFFCGSFQVIDLGLDGLAVLALNACLSLAFFVQHSGMIRQPFRQWLGRFVGTMYHGAVYTMASSTLIVIIFIFWQQSGHTIASVQGPLRWVLRGVFISSFAGFYWGVRALGTFDALGISSVGRPASNKSRSPGPLRVRGPYRWVRHPLYFFVMLMIWTCPDLTVDRLLFNLLWTGWIVVGTALEERDLVAMFGDQYRAYQQEVPMLIPMSIRPAR